MLAIFDRSVAKSPEGLRSPAAADAGEDGGGGGGCGAAALPGLYSSGREEAVVVSLGNAGSMVYSVKKQNHLLNARLFASLDDMFCLFHGHIENVAVLKQQYGLNKPANEVTLVIEAYRTLRDRGPYPADLVVRGFHGKFAFVIYDAKAKSVFIAADAEGGIPFFWGADSGGHLVFSDDVEAVKQACGKSFAPFPKGCFFTSSRGLQSYEHPMNELKPVPRVDSHGEVCGATYKVDEETKKDSSSIPRVGSAADWSAHF